MSVQRIANARTGEVGYQARIAWQTKPGGSRYFSCRKWGPRKAKWMAEAAEKELKKARKQ
jgi:hypothetical protein